VQERRDGLVFIRPVVERDRRNTEQVRNVRNLRALTELLRMEIGGAARRFGEA
jgi:hypothetical protein